MFFPHFFLLLVSSDVNIQKAEEGKLCQRKEYKDRADYDEDVQGSGVSHLGLGLPSKPDGDHGQRAGGAQTSPGGDLLSLNIRVT